MTSSRATLRREPPGPPRRTQQERSDTTRAKLLDAAVACLSEYGYAGTTTAQVCLRAGLTRGAQLHHYPAKQQLLEAAVERLSAVEVEAFDQSLAHAGSGEEQLSAFLDGIFRTLEGPLFGVSLELLVAARTDEALSRAVTAATRRMADVVRQRVRAVANAVRPADPEPLADLLDLSVHLVHGFGLDGVLKPRPGRTRRLYSAWRRQVEAVALTERSPCSATGEAG